MKKLVCICCVAAILAACKSTTTTTTNTPNETTTATTTTTTTEPEAAPEAVHNYSIYYGIGSHYIVNDIIYNEIAIEIDGMPEYFSVSENIISNADYIVVLDNDKIITFKEA